MPPDCPEQVQAQQIIIIHPGSFNLRIGRASDLNPHRILHAVARRRKPGGHIYSDPFLPASIVKSKELLQELEDCRLQVSHTLQSCLQSDGRRRYATPPQQISAFNRRSTPDVVVEKSEDWLYPNPNLETVFGEEILDLDPHGQYNVHFPMRRGEFNVHPNVGGSVTCVLADLQEIWEYVLQCKMDIKLSDLHSYKAVLVIPDIYHRGHLKELMNLLLTKIGFGSCFFVQDHVAATFGAGLGYACVVDVGDQKTSVSCVEDGISHPNTRVRLEYGGADVTQTFHWLLQKCAFPYKECDEKMPQDAMLLKSLKEEFCHVNLDICGSQEKSFKINQPGKSQVVYTLQVGDECIVAPLSLFHTELLGVTGVKKEAKVQKPAAHQADPEDCFDAEYLRETGRKGAKEQMDQSQNDGTGLPNNDNPEEDIVVDALEVERELKPYDKEFVLPGGQIIGLDQAVLQSIERCPNDELKRKMYGCILVVGGGMKFIGIGKWLQNRVGLQIPYLFRSEHLDIVTSPKEMDPAMTAWKGAAVMSCLESAPELWIMNAEWQKHGLRILREKAPFMWNKLRTRNENRDGSERLESSNLDFDESDHANEGNIASSSVKKVNCSDDHDVIENGDQNSRGGSGGHISEDSSNDSEEYVQGSEEIEIEGRRVVDLSPFVDQLRRISLHNGGNCSFSELKIVKEIRIGFHSKVIFECGECFKSFRTFATDDEKTTDTLDINSSAVIGANMTGIGYSQLEQFASIIDVPAMCNDKFKSINDKMGKFWEETAEKIMREAAENEARLAIERGDVDPIDGIPFITVVVDGCWSKRSYNKNFTALSGIGAIVGAETVKVLSIGVRNKYCVICVRAKNKDITPRPHSCTRNFTGPSSEMEWEIILEGFKSCVDAYNLRFLKIISDGDSSTYLKLLEHKPYQDRHIQKIECTNHLFRNFRKNIEAAVKGCPRGLNKFVVDNLERIRKDIHCAINFRKKGNTSEDEKISMLKSDLNNLLRHVFGDHANCPTYIKSFCKDDENYVPALEQCNTFEKMSGVMRKLMYCAKDLIRGENNNYAEHYNSIVAKFVGGKRVNFSLSNAYRYRANAAAVQFNTKQAFSELYKAKFNVHAPPLARKVEVKRLRKSNQGKERRKIMKQNKIIRVPFYRSNQNQSGSGYGPGSQQPDLSEADFDNEKRIHFEKLKKNHSDRVLIEQKTHEKQQCNLWNEIVPKIVLSRDFGSICKARSLALQVKEKTKRRFVETKSMRHQNESQSIALQQLGTERNLTIGTCGLYIDDDHIFLAASPAGIIVGTNMIVEIQCPLAITNMDPNDPAVLAQLDFMGVTKETLELKKSHNIYFDIQGQLHICKKAICLFAIWTSNRYKIYVERVERDDSFFESKMKNQMISFYNDWLVPELIDPRLMRSMPVREPNK